MPPHEQVPVIEAAGTIGAVQVAIGIAVLVYAVVLATRGPRARRGVWIGAGLVAAFVPVVIGHAAMLSNQMRVLREADRLPPGESDRALVHGMESATVHTWIGWAASGVAFGAVLLARWRCRRA